MNGFVHSTESFGTVDGPGVRFVIFLQGCPMRCKYCHNPDTWKMNSGALRSAQSLLKEYERNAAFYNRGGITVTGGEPLLQKREAIAFFEKAKAYWPDVSMRLYTSGDLLDEETLARFQAAGLEEIRFSLKLEDESERMEKVYAAMA